MIQHYATGGTLGVCLVGGQSRMSRGRHRPLDFFGITPPPKTTPVFTLSLRDSHQNTVKTVIAPSHPTMYIQPNTPLIDFSL